MVEMSIIELIISFIAYPGAIILFYILIKKYRYSSKQKSTSTENKK